MRAKQVKELLFRIKDMTETGIVIYHTIDNKEFISYADLYEGACRYIGNLQEAGIQKGQEVIIDFSDYRSYLFSLWACFLGDFICIPIKIDTNQLSMIRGMLNQCYNPVIISETNIDELLDDMNIKVFHEETLDKENKNAKIDEDYYSEIVMVQFSSGSTSVPKGVMLTNEQILCNVYDSIKRREMTSNDTLLTWTPITHNLSIICGQLFPVVLRNKQVILSTTEFITNPQSWLEICSKEKVSMSIMTNYGIMNLLRVMDDDKLTSDLDMSHMKHILTGSDMISPEHSKKFVEKMKCWGASEEEIFVPGYGLSEATLVATLSRVGENNSLKVDPSSFQIGQPIVINPDLPTARNIISVGPTIDSTQIKICDLDGNEVPESALGIVELKGPSIMKGYYRNPEMTKQVLDESGWLNTGDIGFLKEERLYLTGRYKELILYNGKNYFSYDIESFIKERQFIKHLFVIVGLRLDNAINDTILCFIEDETEEDKNQIDVIKEEVLLNFKISIDQFIFLKQIPRTSSNKISKYELQRRYASGEWKNQSTSQHKRIYNEKEIEAYVIDAFSEVLEEKVTAQSRLSELNFDSLQITMVHEKLRKNYPDITVADLFEMNDISDLIHYIYLLE